MALNSDSNGVPAALSLGHLRAFATAGQLGSLNATATTTHRSQSAISYAIACVERHFGVPLLNRRSDGCSLTGAGEIVNVRISNLFDRLARAARALLADESEIDVGRAIRSLNLSHLEAVIELTKRSRVQVAALELGISERTLVRRVHEVEIAMGKSIFHRVGRTFEVPPHAIEFVTYLNLARLELRRAMGEISRQRSTTGSTISIGCTGVCRTELAPLIIEDLHSRYPLGTVRILDRPFADLYDMLLAGEIDALLGPSRPGVAAAELDVVDLYSSEGVIVCRRSHPLQSMGEIDIPTLAEFDWVLPHKGSTLRTALESSFADAGLPLRVALETSSTATAWASVLRSDSLTIATVPQLRYCGQTANLQVLPHHLNQRRTICLYHLRETVVSPVRTEVINAILQAAASICASTISDVVQDFGGRRSAFR